MKMRVIYPSLAFSHDKDISIIIHANRELNIRPCVIIRAAIR